MGEFEISVDVMPKKAMHRELLKCLEAEMNMRLVKGARKIKREFGPIFVAALKAQPEYQSILDGELREHFGIPDGNAKLDTILDKWVKTVRVETKKFKFGESGSSSGGLRLSAVRSDFADVLYSEASYQMTEQNQSLHWLKWLLLEGDKVIIREYIIDDVGVRGRAGGRTMVYRKTGTWSVPLGFRGDETNNWTTRAIDAADNEFRLLLESTFN